MAYHPGGTHSIPGTGGGLSGTVTGSSLNTVVFACQYHSKNAPYLYFTHLPPMLYSLSNSQH